MVGYVIEIVLGLPGSGKTSSIVREMVKNEIGHNFYTNILPMKPLETPQMIYLTPEMIMEEYFKNEKDKKPSFRVNVDYWKKVIKPISVVLDEAHTLLNSRNSMSTQNKVFNQWASLIRRVLGSSEGGYGKLVLITQRIMAIDCHLREMATRIKYYKSHYRKVCSKCGLSFSDCNTNPDPLFKCPGCNGLLKKVDMKIECWEFKDTESYNMWNDFGHQTFYKHYIIQDIQEYWSYYDTEQWEGLTL